MSSSLTLRRRIGKKRVLVIPKAIAKIVGLDEGSAVRIKAVEGKIVIEPIRNAIWLSLHGEKVARITLRELEGESVEQQARYLSE